MHFQGTLDMFSADDALRVISARGATGKLTVADEHGAEAILWFDLGMIVLTQMGADDLTDASEVVDTIGAWTSGTFEFVAGDPPAADAAPQPAEMLLACSDVDSLLHIGADTTIEMARALAGAPAILDVVTWQVLATIIPGMTVNELANAFHAPVIEVIAVVRDLVYRGLVDAAEEAAADEAAESPFEAVEMLADPMLDEQPESAPAVSMGPDESAMAALLDMGEPGTEAASVAEPAPVSAATFLAGSLFLNPEAAPAATTPESVGAADLSDPAMPNPALADDALLDDALLDDALLDDALLDDTLLPSAPLVDTPLDGAADSVADEGAEPADNRSLLLRFLGSVDS